MARPPSRARTAGSDKGCGPGLGSSVPCDLVSIVDSSTVEVGSNVEGSSVKGSISPGSSEVQTEY